MLKKDELLTFARNMAEAFIESGKISLQGAEVSVDTVTQVLMNILLNNEVPTKQEVELALGLRYVPDAELTEKDVIDIITSWASVNVRGLTDGDVKNIVYNYLPLIDEPVTREEVRQALSIQVTNKQEALNFTVDQVKTIINNVLSDLNLIGLSARTDAEITGLIYNYMQQYNIQPSKDEIKNALNLQVVNQLNELNFTTSQIRDIIAQYILDNSDTIAEYVQNENTNTYIENQVNLYTDAKNVQPTKQEIKDALNLTNNDIKPLVNLIVSNTLNIDEQKILDTFSDRVIVLNNDILLQNVNVDKQYMINTTMPMSNDMWLKDTAEYIDENNEIQEIVYKDYIKKIYINYGDKIDILKTDFTSDSSLSIAVTSLNVTIDGKRVVGINSGSIEVWDNPLGNGFTKVATLSDNTYKQVISDEIGQRLLGLSSDKIVIYKLNRTDSSYEVEADVSTSIELNHIASQADILYSIGIGTDNKMYRYQLDISNEQLLDRGEQILVDSLDNTETISNVVSLRSSIDGKHLLAVTSDNGVIPIFGHPTDIGKWIKLPNTSGSDIGSDVGMSIDMSVLYILSIDKHKIITYKKQEAI